MIVFGHVPAWLHVATCDSHCHSQSWQSPAADAPEEVVSACPHGCSHHGDLQASDLQASDLQASDSDSSSDDAPQPSGHPDHDSESCAICQSLVAPTGVTWELGVASSGEFVSEPIVMIASRPSLAAFLAIPKPRGPPTILA